mgnify:CR=1 FL=1
MREKNPSMEFANKTALAYSAVCKPLCQELGLPQTAFDILLFLANNPTYKTASDIVEVRHIKANLVERSPQDRAALHRKGSAHHPAGPGAAGSLL